MQNDVDMMTVVENVMAMKAQSYGQQTWRFVWRLSVLIGVLTAGLWTVWSRFLPVPVIDKILLVAPRDYLVLAYPISHWWDVILIPIWVGLGIFGLRWLLQQQQGPYGVTVVGLVGAVAMTVATSHYGLSVGLGWVVALVLGQLFGQLLRSLDFGLPTSTTLFSVLGILSVVTFGGIAFIVLVGAILVWFLADWRLAAWLHGY